MSYTSSPFAGVGIAFRCIVDIRGTSNPLSVDVKSSNELASGAGLLMPTFCENDAVLKTEMKIIQAMLICLMYLSDVFMAINFCWFKAIFPVTSKNTACVVF